MSYNNVKLKYLLLLLTLCLSPTANGQELGLEQARKIAKEFFVSNVSLVSIDGLSSSKRNVQKARSSEESNLYIFNNETKPGFVVLESSNNDIRIIGYSNSVSINSTNVPENVRWWFNEYKKSGAIRRNAKSTPRRTIAPLLSTKWAQSEPYNCMIPNLGSMYEPFVTGCTSTAISQVMKYYEYPQKGIGSNSYSITYNGNKNITFSGNFANTYYDWNNMLDDYSMGYTQKQAEAVGKLIYHVGVSENTTYGSRLSSADDRQGALAMINNFDYDKSLTRRERQYYTNEQWEDIIYNELANGRPVLYSGVQNSEEESIGHEFVCHGYDAEMDLYAINWGWGGLYDGYFAITGKMAINPYSDISNKAKSIRRSGSSNNALSYDYDYFYFDEIASNDMDCDKEPQLSYQLVATTDNKPVVGVVADGVSQVKIVLDNSSKLPSSKCGYSYKWELSENIGSLENTSSWNNVIYTAPEDFPQNKRTSSFTIQAILTLSNGNVSFKKKIDIKIYRVPVLFVHGLNSNPDNWTFMIRYLRDKAEYCDNLLFHCADYSKYHNDSFETNQYVVGRKAKDIINTLKDAHKIIASKVDVIGHSMGGLLTKKFIQKEGANLFHKLITINTPHGGSQLGNFVTHPGIKYLREITRIERESDIFLQYPMIRRALFDYLNSFNPNPPSNIYNGAVADLSVGCDAIQQINRGSTSGVKCHAITSTSEATSAITQGIIWASADIGKCLGYESTKDFLIGLYNGDKSDLVVPYMSQLGGLSGATTSTFSGQAGTTHLTSCINPTICNRVLDLLKQSVNSSSFSNGFRQTPTITFNMPPLDHMKEMYPDTYHFLDNSNNAKARVARLTDDIHIDHSNYSIGDTTMTIKLVHNEDVKNVSYMCIIDDKIIDHANSKDGIVVLPKNTEGCLNILFEGQKQDNDSWFLVSDSIQINTLSSLNLQKIEFESDTIYIRKGEAVSPSIISYWKDESITSTKNYNVKTSNTPLVKIKDNNIIQAVELGNVLITASYLGQECSAVIIVFDTPAESVELYDEEEHLTSYGYTSNQTIYTNIMPNNGGAYTIQPAAIDRVIMSSQSANTVLETLEIDRSKGADVNVLVKYTPGNPSLANANFRYGIIARNSISGVCYYVNGGSTADLQKGYLPMGAFYANPVSVKSSTSFIPFNGKYEILPSYSLDGGKSWQPMLYDVSLNMPTISIIGGTNPERIHLPIEIATNQVQVGRSVEIQHDSNYTGDIIYTTSNTAVANVTSDGIVNTVAEGLVTIQANIIGDDVFLPEVVEFELLVTEHEINPLILYASKNELQLGDIAFVQIPSDYYGNICYDVEPKGIINVSENGLISTLSDGVATIMATTSSTYDYYKTVSAITVSVKNEKIDLEDDLCISKKPIIGTENVIYDGNSTMSVTYLNNTDDYMYDATLYFSFILDRGVTIDGYTSVDLPSGTSDSFTLDVLDFKNYMTPGKEYTCYFYKDPNYSLPMNIPYVKFLYEQQSVVEVKLDGKHYTTICLPFDANVPQDMKAFELKALAENEVVLNEVKMLKRNHSYIILGGDKKYVFAGVPINNKINPRYGFMTGLTINTLVPSKSYVVSDSGLKKIYAPENRDRWTAYFSFPDDTPNPLPIISLGDEDTESAITPISINIAPSNRIYSIEGKELGKIKKGLNIISDSKGNFYKVLVK